VLPSAFATASAPGLYPYAAQWLACELPYRRFAFTLTDADARLGAGVVRYSFTVSDFHRLLLAGLPAHCEKLWTLPMMIDAPTGLTTIQDVARLAGVSTATGSRVANDTSNVSGEIRTKVMAVI
jgi:hypothetical protein